MGSVPGWRRPARLGQFLAPLAAVTSSGALWVLALDTEADRLRPAETRRRIAVMEAEGATADAWAKLNPREINVRRVARLIDAASGNAKNVEVVSLRDIEAAVGASWTTAGELRQEAGVLLDGGYDPMTAYAPQRRAARHPPPTAAPLAVGAPDQAPATGETMSIRAPTIDPNTAGQRGGHAVAALRPGAGADPVLEDVVGERFHSPQRARD
ncbi:hypothetical protein [Streptomyces caniscabiei]|uniref:hypothetical protein n=1 Tax=Streptomyces caniscabiei TaxID=2746961 RepID=UPI000A361EFE|nr:hypothetical protein [Streptomyces caniscabiei]